MKSLLHILLFFLLLTQIHFPQWTNQNPVPDGNHLWSTFFVDDNTGWIVGAGGFIKKTTNAGLDWVQQSSGTTLTLKSVQFINQNTGWICGDAGLIIKTTDGGLNWFELTSGTTAGLTDLQFCDANLGYVVGTNGTILKTTNAGTSWISQVSGTSNILFAVDFIDGITGYSVGTGRNFLKTTNGGISWTVTTLDIHPFASTFNCVEFIDANIGWIGSGDHYMGDFIHKTTDGGQTWTLAGTSRPYSRTKSREEHFNDNMYDSQVGIRSIYFKDAYNGYATIGTYDGWSRGIRTTTNGGATWQSKYFHSEQTGLLSVFVNSNGKGWAVGYYGVMFITEDTGASWSQILSGKAVGQIYSGEAISSIFMLNDSLGWAGGWRKNFLYRSPLVLKTSNGGKIWKTCSYQTQLIYSQTTYLFFLNDSVGWQALNYESPRLYKTTNGGKNWIDVGSLPGGGVLSDLFFINPDTGWMARHFGIYKSSDEGVTWTEKSPYPVNDIFFLDINNGWAVGYEGRLKTTDEGETWEVKSNTGASLIRFLNSNFGVCKVSGGIELTTDGGDTWINKTAPSIVSLNILNPSTIWGNTSDGTVFKTTNMGDSWEAQNVGASITGGTFFTNENSGWLWQDNNNIFNYFVEPIPLLTLTSPNGGEIWKSGWQRNITWTSENISNINLYYSTNSGSSWNTIASNVDASSGSYNWTVPILTWFINLNCKVKIEDASNSSVYDESDDTFIIWYFCNIIQYANLGQRVIDFLETNIDISLNVTTSDNISVTYYPYETPAGGTLPSGVVVLSDYYWQVTSTNLIFSNGKMIVPISTLRGVTDATKLVWLKRTNSGDDWENIGGIVSGENLESTIIFNSFSEFAIGSTDPVNPLPVELYSFEALVSGSSVNLKWKTKTEVNNYGFEVERCVENSWGKIGFVQGYGNSNSPKSYSFSDNNPFGGSKFQYRLKQLDTDGPFEYSDIVEVEILPNKFALFQNYPNPFNPTTKIRYQLPEESKVIIKIYDILGTEVATLVNEKREPGNYEVELNAQNLSSGTYIYRIVAGSYVETKKMVLMK